MMKPPLLSPDPGPMPTTPPGIPPPPPLPPPQQAPQPGSPGAASSPQPGATPQPSAGDPNAGETPETPENAAPGDVRPRLIPGSDATSGDVPASPEEQADLEQVMVKAGNMIHSRTSRDQVLQQMHDPGQTVAQAVGRTAATILMQIDGQRKATGQGPLDHDVLMEAARHVIPELMDVGISAGLFPLKPTAGGAGPDGQSGPGVGSDPYNREIRMALLEATKVYGEQQLRQPNSKALTEQAQNEWAQGVRNEVQGGTADPRYMAMARPQSGGQPALINTDQGGAPDGS